MVDEAKRLREEKVADLAVKEARRDELEAVKVEKEREKEAAEVPEKEALDFYRRVEEEERRKQEEQEKEAADAEAAEYFTGLDRWANPISDCDICIYLTEYFLNCDICISLKEYFLNCDICISLKRVFSPFLPQ